MNNLLADNKVSTLRAYLAEKLEAIYSQRESANIVNLLFEAFHGWSRTDVVLNADKRFGESELLKYHFALKRLAQGEPVQYVLGYGWFMDMRIATTPAVLIPRPETEELVRLVAEHNIFDSPRVIDIGTGSGCIAIGVKKSIEQAVVTAIDISEEALDLAKKNAVTHHCTIDFAMLDILHETPQGVYDIIVSNPPYVAPSEAARMAKRVTEHEPHLALFTADEDTLIFYRRLMELTPGLLSNEGLVFCEIHEKMADALMKMAEHYALNSPAIHVDMQGKNRMMTWRNN
jgi:release factor glutamine methyltransferase